MQWGAELFQCFPCSSFKEWQNATVFAQKVVANRIPPWAGQGKGPRKQTQTVGVRSKGRAWGTEDEAEPKDFLPWEILDSRTTFQGRQEGKALWHKNLRAKMLSMYSTVMYSNVMHCREKRPQPAEQGGTSASHFSPSVYAEHWSYKISPAETQWDFEWTPEVPLSFAANRSRGHQTIFKAQTCSLETLHYKVLFFQRWRKKAFPSIFILLTHC